MKEKPIEPASIRPTDPVTKSIEGQTQGSAIQRQPSAKEQLEAQLHRMQEDFPPDVGDIPAAG